MVDSQLIKIPSEKDAIFILEKVLNKEVKNIKRFSTGSEHYVYDVTTKLNKNLVVRIGKEDARKIISGAVYWHNILKQKGVPLPKLLFSEIEKNLFDFPVIIMERLKGQDLGSVYPQLTSDQKRKLSQEIYNIQNNVASLPHAHGFGYATSYEDNTLKQSWISLLENQLERSKKRIIEIGLINLIYYNQVKNLVNANKEYFSTIKPIGFLDDTTTKNVIIDNGKLTGVVDTDYVCFGDSLFVVALTQMALLSKGYNTDYISYWTDLLKPTTNQRKALIIYTIMHCVGFMSELGHAFNKTEPKEVSKEEIRTLINIFESLIKELKTKY